jgi:hypothetical protein
MDEPMIRAWIQDATAPDPAPAHRPGRWVAETEWPSQRTGNMSLHVTPGGLSDTASDQPVTIACPETAGHAAQVWCMYGAGADGPLDQRTEEGYMAVFDTAPLPQDIEILGFPILHLRVASDVVQANLAAVMSLVAPDGRATFVSHGVLNLTHRDGHAEPSSLPIGTEVDAVVQLNVVGQTLPAGYRLRLALSQAYWPIIWPSAEKAVLAIGSARLDLPTRPPAPSDAQLPEFGPAEGTEPLRTEVLEPGSFHRRRSIDYATGVETHERFDDTGLVTHLHTGITLRAASWDIFRIHPDDPNSAQGTCRWEKSFARGDWRAELETEVQVSARADVWRIRAHLVARDADGVVAEADLGRGCTAGPRLSGGRPPAEPFRRPEGMAVFPAFGPGAETHSLTTEEGVRMRVVEEGDGPPVVFVPGGDQTADAYSQQFSRLSDRFRCIAYDPRGAGETTAPPPPWSMEDYARDCAAVIDAFCGGQAAVAGLSLGGLVTQATAIAFPGRCRLRSRWERPPISTVSPGTGCRRKSTCGARASAYRNTSWPRITQCMPFPQRPFTSRSFGHRSRKATPNDSATAIRRPRSTNGRPASISTAARR